MRARLLVLISSALSLAAGCSSGTANNGPSFGNGSQATDAIARACGAISGLSCSKSSQSECEAEGAKTAASAEKAGCVDELTAVADCYVQNPPTCGPDGLKINPACGDEVLKYAQCDPSAVCTSTSTQTSCSIHCGDAAMSCEQANNAWACNCTSGPQSGRSFTQTTSDPCDNSIVQQNCE